MSTYIIDFDSEKDKRDLYMHLRSLSGIYNIRVQKVRKYEGRYKYYFGHVLRVIAEKEIYCDDNGVILFGNDLHEALKMKYNPMIVSYPAENKIIVQGKSTTGLSDYEFINDYEFQIIADHSQAPYYCEFIDRVDWTQQRIEQYEKNERNTN